VFVSLPSLFSLLLVLMFMLFQKDGDPSKADIDHYLANGCTGGASDGEHDAHDYDGGDADGGSDEDGNNENTHDDGSGFNGLPECVKHCNINNGICPQDCDTSGCTAGMN
jgi:hypothetical protein